MADGLTMRLARSNEAEAVLGILEEGRRSLAELGIDQWQNGYPNREIVDEDIALGACYVAEDASGALAGTLALRFDCDEDYEEAGIDWLTGEPGGADAAGVPYAAIHRCATVRSALGQGVMGFMFERACEIARAAGRESVRVDTHLGNRPMRGFLAKHGFTELESFNLVSHSGGDPNRIAYEKVLAVPMGAGASASVAGGGVAAAVPAAAGDEAVDGIWVFEDEALQRRMLVASFAVLAVGAVLGLVWFLAVRPGLGLAPTEFSRGLTGFWELVALLVCAASFALHEGVHAVFFRLFAASGAHVTFGADWKLGLLYACANGIVYTRRQYQAIIAAPSVVVTALLLAGGALLGYPVIGYALAVLHLTGCTGDWAYLIRMARDRTIDRCEDTSWGVRFYHAGEALDGEGAADAGVVGTSDTGAADGEAS